MVGRISYFMYPYVTFFYDRLSRKIYYQHMSYFANRDSFLDIFVICRPIADLFDIWKLMWVFFLTSHFI